MAVKFGRAFGAEVTVLSQSETKREDAARLGAADFALTSKADTFGGFARRFDFILDTVSAAHDYSAYLDLLKTDGTMILVGAPDESTPLGAFPLILRRRRLVGDGSSAASKKHRRCWTSARSTRSPPTWKSSPSSR